MRLSLLRRAGLVGLVVASLVAPGAIPAQAAETGTVSGRLTTSTGAGAADATVYVYEPKNFFVVDRTDTDADGNWSVPGLAAGSYAVGFFRAEGGPEQFYRQQTSRWDAERITVTANETTTVDEQLIATGTIRGQIRDTAGNPVVELMVEATRLDTYEVTYARTEPDGRYQMPTWAGTYQISFRPVEGLWQSQYVPGKLDKAEAGQYTVTAGSETVVDETVLPTGSLSGTLTSATGKPIANAYVGVNTVNMHGGVDTRTGADGTFTVPTLLAGSYKIMFDTGSRQQFYDGKLTHEEADVVTVQGGQTTTVTESLLGTGSVQVSAVDSVTGAPIADFCAHTGCSNGTGRVTITGLPEGRHDLYLYTNTGRYFARDLLGVQVQANQTTRVSPAMRPGAVITTTVVDAQTGAALPNVCLAAFLPKRAALLDGYNRCSNSAGQISVGPLDTGTYKLFANPQQTTYGRQWVGANGGTGDEQQAVSISATAGTVVTGPQVRMDRAGTISGTVTDAATGAPLRDVFVSVLTGHPGLGAEDATTDEDGRYTLTKLGPYDWPVVFGSRPYGYQWSGNAASRFTATPVTVTTGGTATYDMAMRAASRATGAVTTPDGTPFTGGFVIARSADTGDIAAADSVENGRFDVPVLGQQQVYFTYEVTLGEESYSGTYQLPDADGVPRAALFTVPASGTLTADLVISTS
ncbi:Carboxypeptidase regulatory-like domain-containing protein [Micromonospora pallida]|uniref:Carboxypeptidase regulatory-like domain-containing protein n=1 Tax=Micromonospora pallida TaxID=145854 RepID=A0A1C6TC91_9ACTN|nr:carboxypeptidase regulatory-like domain-containing protein [Micromonospora pallida]SCL39095.1 Carboxypeptidase regulatory-like domain-containing protein [Micromonospora pallida]